MFVAWREVLRYAGNSWDETDPAKDKAALVRYNRAEATLDRRGYFVGDSLRAEAPAGDSVEIVCRVRGSRNHPGGLRDVGAGAAATGGATEAAAARIAPSSRLRRRPGGSGALQDPDPAPRGGAESPLVRGRG